MLWESEVKHGRPKLPKSSRRSKLTTFRMSAEERSIIERAAKKNGERLSDWIRVELWAAAEKQLTDTEKEPRP